MRHFLLLPLVIFPFLACKAPLLNTQVGSTSQPAVSITAPPVNFTFPPGLVNFQPGSIAPVVNAPVSQDLNLGKVAWAIGVAAVVIACVYFWFKVPPYQHPA